jgi:putative glutathione S-transferase
LDVPKSRVLKSSSSSNDSAGTDNSSIDKGFNLLEVASKVVPQGNIVRVAKFGWKFIWSRFMAELAPRDKATGDYKRPTYGFDKAIQRGETAEYPAEAGRYHLYVGNPCPWCHRVRLVVNLLGLESVLDGVTVLVDNPEKASRGGWIFGDDPPLSTSMQAGTFQDLRELYDYLSPGYTGRCTAPLLVDWKTQTIVSNESKDIVRMLPLLEAAKNEKSTPPEATAAAPPVAVVLDTESIPADLQATIDEQNEWIYELVNNGVYRCGFATTQGAYEAASKDVLEGLARLEKLLSAQDFVSHEEWFTESDLMLLPTILRYDGVYGPLFRAGGTHLRLECDYPSVFRWLKRCWTEVPGVKESIDITDACESYYKQLFPLNPGGIVPTPAITAKSLNLE